MTTRATSSVILLFVFLGGLGLGGCSTFNRDWNALEQPPELPPELGHESASLQTPDEQPVQPDGIEGRWEGTWSSEANGHHGGLRCIISRDDQETLIARYHATYGWCFTFEYSMPMEVDESGETIRFSAQADLGWLAGGQYEYEGTIIGDAFSSTYECKRDHGIFEMKRVD
ncbi:MAG: hypothetical protein O7G85_04580 [Planctomycetota bacterium]|nr:hypothetical protein [Planctomycetota bacterium]